MIWDSLYLLNKNISRKLIGFQESSRSVHSGKHEYSPRFPKIICCHVMGHIEYLFVSKKVPLLAFLRFLWSWRTWLWAHLYLKLKIPTTLWRGTNMPSMDNITVIVTFYFEIHQFGFISSFKFQQSKTLSTVNQIWLYDH